jgi:hypothetical protein
MFRALLASDSRESPHCSVLVPDWGDTVLARYKSTDRLPISIGFLRKNKVIIGSWANRSATLPNPAAK